MYPFLLRHIKDKSELWAEIWCKHVNLVYIPYCMFTACDIGGRHYFELPLDKYRQIYRRAYPKVRGEKILNM